MKSSTGRWVSGDDFLDRDRELGVLESRVREGNHIVMTGQRRMGKTSVLRELGRRLEEDGWIFLFADVEGAASEEDVVTKLAEAVHRVRPIASRGLRTMGRRLAEWARGVEQLSAHEFAIRFRAVLNSGNWRRHGEQLLAYCARFDKPVLIAVDEVPIFLVRLLEQDGGDRRVDEFLSWLRAAFQQHDGRSPVLIVSGSIGLAPLVRRLGIPDRINYLHPFRLGPWDRETSVRCIEVLARNYGLSLEAGVADAACERLGIGIPHHVQSFFAGLREHALMNDRKRIVLDDVAIVYQTELLGPSGQNDLSHYETRLRDGLGDGYGIAMKILAEAAVGGVFTADARRHLEVRHSKLVPDAPRQMAETLDVLVHDGYLEPHADGHRFASKLLGDWWKARFRDHHAPLAGPSGPPGATGISEGAFSVTTTHCSQ